MNLACQYRKARDSDRGREPPDFSWLEQTLAPAEVELFKHYLEHTSRDPSVDSQDQYALQIGIPKLARHSKPLMKSVLALAAVCKCCDIIRHPSSSHDDSDRGQVIELLSLAHRYHQDSLREIQATLHEANHYDRVLANAAMMGMYGSANHCTRIWLAKTATPDGLEQPLCDLTAPGYPQWMSLFRAARLAYAGLLGSTPCPSPAGSPLSPSVQCEVVPSTPSRIRVEQPKPPTIISHPLAPILAATLRPALARLQEKAAFVQARSHTDTDTQLQACFAALSIFTEIATASLLPHGENNNIVSHPTPALPTPLLNLPPWLQHYAANITSMMPSPLPRRTIMSFIHKVPAPYLDLVEAMMQRIQIQTSTPPLPSSSLLLPPSPSSSSSTLPPSGSDVEGTVPPDPPSLAHQLAVEIFAHWLVLVLLLDGVWWIGGVGAWELGRVLEVRRVRWAGERCLWDWEGGWWPEGMRVVAGVVERFKE